MKSALFATEERTVDASITRKKKTGTAFGDRIDAGKISQIIIPSLRRSNWSTTVVTTTMIWLRLAIFVVELRRCCNRRR